MRGVPTPSARAASTIVCSRSESTEARTSRITRGISGITSAMMTLRTLPRISAIRASASRMAGMAIRPSITRIITVSSRAVEADDQPQRGPERQAQQRHRGADRQRDRARRRACACRRRGRSGRSRTSAPPRAAAAAAPAASACGSPVHHSGASTAADHASAAAPTSPATNVGCRRANRTRPRRHARAARLAVATPRSRSAALTATLSTGSADRGRRRGHRRPG